MNVSKKYVVILTTTDDHQIARKLATSLIDERLAACVQVTGPIESFYRWQGKTETSQEWRCLIKTTTALLNSASDAIRQNHNYDVPQIIAIEFEHGDDDYLAWIEESVNR